MRLNLIALLLFITVSTHAQIIIKVIVKDSITNTPLPFATIIENSGQKIIGKANGSFSFKTCKDCGYFIVKYADYKPAKIKINQNQLYHPVKLVKLSTKDATSKHLESDSLAKKLILEAIDRKASNDPEKKLKSFRFKTYHKLLITANKDSVSNLPDSVFIRKKGKFILKEIDSTRLFLKKQLQKSHLYISEKVSEIRFLQSKRRQEYIMASKMGGFDEPVNELLTLDLQSFSLYKDSFTIMGNEFKGPLGNRATRFYDYKVLDTINRFERVTYLIYFKPSEYNHSKHFSGLIYLDKESFAIQKGILDFNKGIIAEAIQDFQYYPDEKVWFPINKSIEVRKQPDADKISLFGNTINLNRKNRLINDSISINSNQQKISDHVKLIANEYNFDIELNKKIEFPGQGIDILLDDNIVKRDTDYWNRLRKESISDKEKETYKFLDSVSKSRKVEKKIGFIRKLTQGYLGTRFVDFDLRYLVKYNNYEGFKPGVGAITNNQFSKKVRLSAYGLYGFKDDDFKYGLGAETKLNKLTDTWLGFMYTDDLTETGSEGFITDGRAFYVFEPRLFNITLFHKTKTLSPYIKHNILPFLTAKFQLNKSDVLPTFEYQFVKDGIQYRNFKTATLQFALNWTPTNTFLLSDTGKSILKKGYPQFTMQYTRGLQNVLDADFNFSKVNFRGIYEFNSLGGSNTSFLLKAAIAWGDLPITELFHVSPNNPDNTSIMRRFSVADSNSFETMFFNEFFSDKYFSFQVRHKLPRFEITGKFKPQLVLVSRLAFGNATAKERHLNFNFNTLEKGFYESGIELNYLFKGFGLSTFYRYGPNALEGFDKNFSFKFTFNFSLGF